MVLCSHLQQELQQTAPIHLQEKMASQLESLSHVSEVYGRAQVQEEPVVHCLASGDCQWEGSYEEILMHCKQCHPDSIWWTGDKTRSYTIDDITKDSYRVELVVAYGHLFWLHVKTDANTNHLYAACQNIVMKSDDAHTRFMVRTELCDVSGLNCISCTTETRPHTEDVSKIVASKKCAVRPIQRLRPFISSNNSITFSVNISKIYYFQ